MSVEIRQTEHPMPIHDVVEMQNPLAELDVGSSGRPTELSSSEGNTQLISAFAAHALSSEETSDSSSLDNDDPYQMRDLVSILGRENSRSLEPRINSSVEADVTQSEAARSRLLLRLDMYALEEKVVEGDGNCQFRSLSDQLYYSPEDHEHVRQQVVNELRRNRTEYQGYVPDEFSKYCEDMATEGTWGDHVTLQAAANAYGVRINVLSSFPENAVIDIYPREVKSSRVLWLSFWAEVHYNSLYPRGDLERRRKKKRRPKKVLGSRRLGKLLGSHT